MPTSTPNSDAVLPASLLNLERRHRALLAEIQDIGLVLRGSVAKRSTRCGRPECRCKASPPQLHGPYYIWTRKVTGKTVTLQLPPTLGALCQGWNRNMHRLDHIVRELQDIGLQAANAVRGR